MQKREEGMIYGATLEDTGLLRKQRQFLEQIERGIAEANREIIHERIPELDSQAFVSLALQVARLRARYLEAALERHDDEDGESAAAWSRTLRERREAYEEAVGAFEALQRAIQRGYVDIGLHDLL